MLAEALVYKNGFAQGLLIVDGKIKEYPVEWGKKPTKKEQVSIVREYTEYLKTVEHVKPRKALYDNGDYVDSLMKDANLRRLAGENLHEDLDKSLGHWLGVKKKVPKYKPKGAKKP